MTGNTPGYLKPCLIQVVVARSMSYLLDHSTLHSIEYLWLDTDEVMPIFILLHT